MIEWVDDERRTRNEGEMRKMRREQKIKYDNEMKRERNTKEENIE
jgi:hypothetical protein